MKIGDLVIVCSNVFAKDSRGNGARKGDTGTIAGFRSKGTYSPNVIVPGRTRDSGEPWPFYSHEVQLVPESPDEWEGELELL